MGIDGIVEVGVGRGAGRHALISLLPFLFSVVFKYMPVFERPNGSQTIDIDGRADLVVGRRVTGVNVLLSEQEAQGVQQQGVCCTF